MTQEIIAAAAITLSVPVFILVSRSLYHGRSMDSVKVPSHRVSYWHVALCCVVVLSRAMPRDDARYRNTTYRVRIPCEQTLTETLRKFCRHFTT